MGNDVSMMKDSRLRTWLVGAVIAGAFLLATAGELFHRDFEPDLLPYLMSIVAGALIGGVVASLVRALPNVVSWIVHVGVVIAGWMFVASVSQADLYAIVPEQAKGLLYAVLLSLAPCMAWISMALVGRLSMSASGKPVTLIEPEWAHEPRRATLTFPAIEMTLRSLTGWIVATVLAGGLTIVAILIATGESIILASPRFMLIFLGVFFGIPAYLVLMAVLRRRQTDYVVVFSQDRVNVSWGGQSRSFRFADINELTWGGRGEYSRLKVKTASGERFEIVAGLAKVPKGVAAVLPPLPRAVETRLGLAGLQPKSGSRSRSDGKPAVFVPVDASP